MSRKNRSNSGQGYADRKMGNRKFIPTPSIVCEGEKTALNYFSDLPVNSSLKSDIVGAGYGTINVIKKAMEFTKDEKFNRVLCVFDSFSSSNKTAQVRDILQFAQQESIDVAYSYELPARIISSGNIEILNFNSVETPIGSKIKVIVLVEEDNEDESSTQSFREGWADVVAGNTIPASQLWE
jgi:hypothetical protein